MDSNKDLDELINNHLNSQLFLDIKVVERSANLFISFEDQFISSVNGETFYKLPYKEITINIFYSDLNEVQTNTFQGFCTTVSEVLNDLTEGNPAASHIIDCYEKFTHHIALAVIQKNFILKSAKEADEIASAARNIANMAQATATKANQSSEKAEILAIKAEDLANEADAQAKSTIANYISILGIFASIIFTLFGGVNLIGSTVKLLEVNSRWPYLTFIIALLMICLLTLLNMMVKWINTMSNLKNFLDKTIKDREVTDRNYCWYKPLTWDFYTKSVSFFLIILLVSLSGMYHVNKESLISITTETTTKNSPKKEENDKIGNKLKSESQNKEVTVVKKITVSNHQNHKNLDKDENE